VELLAGGSASYRQEMIRPCRVTPWPGTTSGGRRRMSDVEWERTVFVLIAPDAIARRVGDTVLDRMAAEGLRRRCQLGWGSAGSGRAGARWAGCRWYGSGCGSQSGDLVPDGESSVISVRWSSAVSRWRRGRKCGEMPLNADGNRCACLADLKRFIARSRCRVG
jgi:hypothetical protein